MPIDPNAPFFRPLWLRLALTGAPLLGSAWAMATGSLGWAIPLGAVGGYLFHALFLNRADRP